MINTKNKKIRHSILTALLGIMLIAGIMTGCSLRESALPEKQPDSAVSDREAESGSKGNGEDTSNESGNERILFEQMAGRWIIDFEKTDASLWGSGISAGNGIELSATGEFSYYIGIGVGGTGRCEDKNDKLIVEIQPYEEHSSEKEILELQYVMENDREYIFMDWHNEDVYWKRENTASDANSPADNPGLETEKTQVSKEILSVDGQEIKELAEKFAAAYFSGDKETVQECLTTPYEWDVEVYAGTETIHNMTIKELEGIGLEEIGSSKVISIEYKNRETEDTFQYLTLELVKQEYVGWKIQFYGIE